MSESIRPQLREYWAEKNNEDEMSEIFSAAQTIPEQLRLFNIAFLQQQWKFVSSLHYFHICYLFWMTQETASFANISITDGITCLQDQVSNLISHCLLWLAQQAFSK